MKRTHNLTTVIKHEVRTVLKQPTFWLTILAMPALIAAVFALSYFSGRSAEQRTEEAAKEVQRVAVVDHSGIIRSDVTEQYQVEVLGNESRAIEEVREGELDGLFVYPTDIAETRQAEVYTGPDDNAGVAGASGLRQLAAQLFTQSLLAPLGSDERIQLAQESINTTITTYKEDGSVSKGIAEYIVPGAFLVLFFIMMVLSLPYIVSGMADEKENRVMELLLTSVKPRVLMTGKLLAVAVIAVVQIALLLALAAAVTFAAYRLGGDNFTVSFSFGFSDIVFDPVRIAFGAGFLVLGYLFFAALAMGVSSLMPSAKEANGLIGPFIFASIIPIYLIGTLTAAPETIVSKIASFFPVSAPISMLVRNTVGTVGAAEALLGLLVLALSVLAALWLATVLFNRGALSYGTAPSILKIFARGKLSE